MHWHWTACKRTEKKRSVCTRPVTAIVVDLQRERVGVDDFSVSGEAVMKSWFPVYEYMIDGVKQKVRARVGTAKPAVNVEGRRWSFLSILTAPMNFIARPKRSRAFKKCLPELE